MTLILIVLPVVVFLLYFGSAPDSSAQLQRFADGKGPGFLVIPACAAVAAALAGFFTLLPMRNPGPWIDHIQVAWTGVRSQRGQTLQIGGAPGAVDESSRAAQNIGWPLNFRFPIVRLEENRASKGSILVSAIGGEGFVREEQGHELLNGQPLQGVYRETWVEAGASAKFTLALGDCGPGHWYYPAEKHCFIITENGVPLTAAGEATVSFPSKTERAFRLSSFVESTVQRLRHTPGTDQERDLMAEQAGSLERWASTVIVLPRCTRCTAEPRPPQLYLLTPQSPSVSERSIANESHIAVIWPTVTLRAIATIDSTAKLSLLFEAPFRHSTPLPPDNYDQLLIENALSPGDTAFLLPLPIGSVPANLQLNPARTQQTSIPHRSTDTLAVSIAPAGIEVLFQKVRSIPNALWPLVQDGQIALVVLVFWAWLFLLGGLYLLAKGRTTAHQKICCMGLVLATWTVLCVRFLLAFRFALDPSHLDLFSVDQMHEALDALCIGPSAVAFCCGIRQRRPKGRMLLLPLIYLLALAVNNLILMPGLWRSLHLSFAEASWTNSSTVTFAGVILLLTAASDYLPRSRRGPSTPSMIAQLIDDKVRHGWWWTLIFGALLSTAIVIAYVANRLPYPSLRSFAKEVGLVLLQYLVIRFGVECLESRDGFVSPKWRRWPLFNWFLLVFFLFILAPPALDDVGGIIAGCGLLLPFAFVSLSALGRSTNSTIKARGVLALSVAVLFGVVLLVVAIVKTPLGDFARKHSPASARINHWLSEYAQGDELGARSVGDHGKRSEEQELAETDEQTWQNKAMIILGDTTGVGFGNSPARRSGIPQHTLQADSTFSFFVASEFGGLGGAALILLFASPLAFVLLCNADESLSQTRIRLAIILMAAFLIECVVHISMNMEIMPMTGRSMPLLSTHSLANTLRWLMLLGLAGFLVWEKQPPGRRTRFHPYWWSTLAAATSLACIAFAFLLGGMFWWSSAQQRTAWERAHGGAAVAHSEVPDEKARRRAALIFTRSDYMNEARRAIQNDPPLLLADNDGRLHRTNALDADHFASIQLGEEVQRFNGLPDDLRLPSNSAKSDIVRQLSSLGPEEYMDALLRDSLREGQRTAPVAPALFRLNHEEYAGLDDTHLNTAPPTILINPAFQNVLDLRLQSRDEIPTLGYSNPRSTVWKIKLGQTLTQFSMQADLPAGDSAVSLDARDGHLTAMRDSGHFGNRAIVQLTHCSEKAKHRSSGTQPVAVFTINAQGELAVQEIMHIVWRKADGSSLANSGHGGTRELEDGEQGTTGRTNACNLRDNLTFDVTRDLSASYLVGPAWAGGQWRTAVKAGSGFSWLPEVARALEASAVTQKPIEGEHRNSYVVTIDPTLQKLTTRFLEEHAVDHFYTRDHKHGVPPRAGAIVLDLASGEVLAMAGWPHSSGEEVPGKRLVGGRVDVQPPERWLDTYAPAEVRNYFLGDRNFNTLPVGSATKPIWAAASIATVPSLARLQTVNPDSTSENEIFGIPVSEKAWGLHEHPHACCDLSSYLAFSDNRFQTRLNFAALADIAPDGHLVMQREPGRDNQTHPVEHFDGARAWGGVPDLTGVGFGYLDSGNHPSSALQSLDSRGMPIWLNAAFPVEIVSTSSRSHSLSFWTANEASESTEGILDDLLGSVSPQRARLDLDRVKDAREFVSILLGGSTNRWSNVNLASGFSTALTGRPMVPHVLHIDPGDIQPARTQVLPPAVPCALRKGLNDVVMAPGGTAYGYLEKARDPRNHYTDRYDLYAKTGTLDVKDEGQDMSRIVLALVNRTGRRCPEDVQSGIILSFFVEQSPEGTASRWLNEFLTGDLDDAHGRASVLRDLMTRARSHPVRQR